MNVRITQLQSTALVNEAYLRLVGQNLPKWESRAHFFAIASQLMRQILVDYARRHRASKRGSGVCMVALDDAIALPQRKNVDVVALDDALNALAEIDPRQSRVVELRFFAGPFIGGNLRGDGYRDRDCATRLDCGSSLAA